MRAETAQTRDPPCLSKRTSEQITVHPLNENRPKATLSTNEEFGALKVPSGHSQPNLMGRQAAKTCGRFKP